MCGIAGIIDFSGNSVSATDLLNMRDRMLHKGLDDFAPVKQWCHGYMHLSKVADRFLKEIDCFNPTALTRHIRRKGVLWIIVNFIY